MKKLFILLLMFALGAQAQTKKTTTPASKGKGKATTVKDSTNAEPEVELSPMEKLELELKPEIEIDPLSGKKVFYKDRKRVNDSLRADLLKKIRNEKRQFWVKTKYPKAKSKERIQLCINIANKDTNLTYCINDSTLRDPEDARLLYQQSKGDTTYMLIYIDAFTKNKNDGGLCNGKKETKIVFARWNHKTNTAKWKQRNIASCSKGITNMSKGVIEEWDKTSLLKLSYHRGSTFYDVSFDPEKPEAGLQSANDSEK
jgi:hypothetical protein